MKAELLKNPAQEAKPKNRLSEFENHNGFGVIRSWGLNTKLYGGMIVKLSKDQGTLLSIESLLSDPQNQGERWFNFQQIKNMDGDFYIEPLPPGTEIKITL